jgi:flagellar biosynthesis/type III secretory pathway chaperone
MVATTATLRAHLSQLLSEEAALLAQLEALLGRETQVLRGTDTEAIEQIGTTRQECTSALARLAADRDLACVQLAPRELAAELKRVLGWCDTSGKLSAQWHTNLTVARRCRDLNDRNGAIVAVKLNHVQTLLATLRGVRDEPDYDPRATRQSLVKSRELGTA